MVKIKRVYDPPSDTDGFRVLIDRLWPRGVSKEDARVDVWLKEIAPSTELRKWFAHDSRKWELFKKKYGVELRGIPDAVNRLKDIVKQKRAVTLVYAAKDEMHNHAVILKKLLEK